ncbi:c-type cytochrome [Paracoccus aestuariivivens]|uniref:Cytochrome C n=1 Tax=Paracoccus aestuariivivens TaxID=1820333 RepID=A0A6L6J938_9RHOB|nr:cytochrome C [Paracoccus aestuariivivens]MTH78026.1 cytochrome C [Paracoccus aestuariivivens]
MIGLAGLAFAGPALAAEGQAHRDYILRCAGCHGMEGLGSVEGGIPTFPGSVGKIAADDMGRTYMMHVPGVISASLDDAGIASVMNYILDRWSPGEAAPFTPDEVTRRRAVPVADVVVMRRDVAKKLMSEGTQIADYPWP